MGRQLASPTGIFRSNHVKSLSSFGALSIRISLALKDLKVLN